MSRRAKSREPRESPPARGTGALVGAAALSFTFVAVASFLPDVRLWGVNHLAFVPLPLRLLALAAVAALFFPGPARALQRAFIVFPRWLEGLTSGRAVLVLLVIALGATGCFFAFQSSTDLLGDGRLITETFEAAHEGHKTAIVRSIPVILKEEYIAPGVSLLFYGAGKAATGVFGKDTPVVGIRAFLCILGGMLVFLFLLLVRGARIAPQLKVWLVVLGLFSATIALYFGYMENYAPLIFFLVLYVAGAFAVMQDGRSVAWPVLACLAACYAHVQGTVFLPSLVFLLAWKWARGRRGVVLRWMPLTLVVLMLAGVVAIRFTLLAKFVLPVWPGGDGREYAVLHPIHLADMANQALMLLPILPVVATLGWIGRSLERPPGRDRRTPPKDERFAQPVEWRFVELMLVGNLIYLVAFRPEIGMARDWDLFAMATVAIVPYVLLVLGRYVRLSGVPTETLARWSAPSLALVIVLGVAWIGINASVWRTADRFEAVLEYDKTHGSYASENLAVVLHDNGRLERAVTLMETTYRTWKNPRHAVRLAMYYEEGGRLREGIQLLSSLLELHPDKHRPRLKLIGLLERMNRWDEILPLAAEGTRRHPREPSYHFYYGESLVRRGDTEAGLRSFLRCLELDPPDSAREHIRRRMEDHDAE